MPSPFRASVAVALAASAVLASAPAGLAAQRLSARAVDSLPSRPADLRRAYGADSLQFGELRLPAGKGPFPVAIVIHGGCWVSRFASLRNTAALADALRREGVATWNVEYRRLDHPGGGWPGTLEDVAAAADFLRTLARARPLDLTRVVAVGHSAGGQLALWLAARKRLPAGSPLAPGNPLPLRGVVSLGGISDLAEFGERDRATCGPVVARLMGGTRAEVPERYAQASPIELLPLGTRQILIAGDSDRIAPQAGRDAYVAAALRAGDRVEQITVPGAGHFEVIAPTTSAWPLVRDAVRSALGMIRPERRGRAVPDRAPYAAEPAGATGSGA